MILIAVVLYLLAGLVNPSDLVLSMILKGSLALSFPFVLFLVNFYTTEELRKLHGFKYHVVDIVKRRLNLKSEKKF